ncbi:flagellar hook-length control protein FliK [Marinospirillum perlucidum]|uniref:flagellar hook-length control protein FliK n=1 Tax=Marinospirillum perlucidum TaxID=1982602 RepID=UPI00138FED16|nr:flagellar hook-length control protein FliK [Marinospirillum perlucidum]
MRAPQAASAENKQAFHQQLQSRVQQSAADETSASRVTSRQEGQAAGPQGDEVVLERSTSRSLERKTTDQNPDSAAETTRAVAAGGKDVPVGGEKLPLPEETARVLDSLDPEKANELLAEVRQWLQGMSDEEMQELQTALAEGDLDSLKNLLPENLQQMLGELAASLDMDLQEMQQGVQQLLARLQAADLDLRQLAGLRYDSQVGELRVRTQPPGQEVAAQRTELAGVAEKPGQQLSRDATETSKNFQDGQQENKGNDKLEHLVARLGRGDTSVINNKATGESMQQLIQAAGMGLGNTPSAQPAVARMAASMPGMPMTPGMAQAAAQANAEALANRIQMMQTRGMQIAEMRLDPPDLGKMKIQLRVQGDQASVVFQSPNAQARDLMENALPRLREMMEEQGLSLTDASVSEESYSGDGEQQEGEAGSGSSQGLAGDTGAGESSEQAGVVSYFDEPLGLVDYYA